MNNLPSRLATLSLQIARTLPPPVKSALWRGARSIYILRAAINGRHRCSVCDGRVATFVPLPPNDQINSSTYSTEDSETCNSKNYTCPHCEATDRDRLYALYLADYFQGLNSSEPIKIIDFAPNPSLSRFIAKFTSGLPQSFVYRTADLMMEKVDDRLDISDMAVYEDQAFDFFICSHVLEHVDDDKAAMAELHRILKRGGRGILMVPIFLTATSIDEDPSVTDPAERWRRFGQHDHVRLYSKAGFLERVRQAGFSVSELGHEFFGKELLLKHGILEGSVLYVVERTS